MCRRPERLADALAHVFYDGKMYNDRDIALVTSRGARANGIEAIKHGVVGRGVLLDLPRHRRIRKTLRNPKSRFPTWTGSSSWLFRTGVLPWLVSGPGPLPTSSFSHPVAS